MIEELIKLQELDFNKQAAFAYLTCERLFPNYVYFSENYKFGNPLLLREAIDFLYLNIFEKKPNTSKVNYFIKEVEKNTPNTENFNTIFVSSALDACTALYHSLHFLINKEFSNISYISSAAIDSVDMYIQEIDALDFNSDKYFQQKIDNHPLMKKEVSIQIGIIAFLYKSKNLDYDDLKTLLSLQDNNKKSNLDL